jgi:NAD+ synthase
MPSKTTPKSDLKDSSELVKNWKLKSKFINIEKATEAICSLVTRKIGRLEFGNIQARIRMVLLYYFANKLNYLVVGTGNKTELLMGYFTKYGDGAADLLPLGDLYKTQVKELANYLEIPKNIIAKVPRAGLWKGQTDEKELGMSYELLDRILYGIELDLSSKTIAEKLGISIRKVKEIERIVFENRHKRRAPLIPKVSIRTLGVDWHEY